VVANNCPVKGFSLQSMSTSEVETGRAEWWTHTMSGVSSFRHLSVIRASPGAHMGSLVDTHVG
jgi:hypothetical protein